MFSPAFHLPHKVLLLAISYFFSFSIFSQTVKFTDATAEYDVPGNTEGDVSAYGHGVSMADINSDGRPDIYISNAVRYADQLAETLYMSTPDGGYQENDAARGVEDSYGWTGSHGIIFVDYDNDGDYDIFNATTDDRNRLYKNTGDGYFQDVTDAAGLPLYRTVFPDFDTEPYGYGTRGVIAFDANNDGFIDLLAVNWGPAETRYNEDDRILIPPQPNEFYLNNGNGTFKTITNNGLTTPLNDSYMGTQGVVAADVDNDGDMDVLIVHRNYTALTEDGRAINGFNPDKQVPNQLMINDGRGNFTNETTARGLFDSKNDANGATFADYDNDGDLDLFVPPKDKAREYVRAYRNRGNGYFDDVTDKLKIRQWGFSTFFLDADNDGDLDIITPRTRDYTEFYRNNGNGNFSSDEYTSIEIYAYDPRGGAVGDIDNDGDLDFYYGDANKDIDPRYSNRLFRNDLWSTNRWIKITGRGPGGDAGGFGTKIWVYERGEIDEPGSLVGYRQVQNAYGYLCQDDPVQHFGIGQRDTVDVKVKMLDGTTLFMVDTPAAIKLFFRKPASMSKSSGDGQTAPVGSLTPNPLVVRVLAKNGKPVHGAAVTFSSNDASAQFQPGTTVYSNKDGYASVYYRLGLNASQIVTAKCTSVPGTTITFTLSGTGTTIADIDIVSGNNQKGQAGYPLPEPLVVVVKDSDSHPLANAAVHFQVTSGDGFVNGESFYETITNSLGQAQVIWTLGPQPSSTQTVDVYPMAKPSLKETFTATALGAAAKLIWQSATHFEGVVNKALPDSLSAKVTDADGHAVAGVNITFEITAGGGQVNGQNKITVPTNTLGIAKAEWTMGQKAGVDNQSLTVTATGLQGSPTIVKATALAGPPYVLVKISGDNQTGDQNKVLPEPFVVAVQDSFKNAVANQPVEFARISGDGSFNGQSSVTITTNAHGKASAVFTAGTAETSTIRVSSTYLGHALKDSPQEFTVTTQGEIPTTITKLDGDEQEGLINAPLAEPFRVRIVSASGEPVANHIVDFRSETDGATFEGQTSFIVRTDSNGVAAATATLGSMTGDKVYSFYAKSLYNNTSLNGSPVYFKASGLLTRAEKIILVSADSIFSVIGSETTDSIKVRVVDAENRAVKNQPVNFRVLSGSCTLNDQEKITLSSNARGYATVAVQLSQIPEISHIQITANNGLRPLTPDHLDVYARSLPGTPDPDKSRFTVPATLVADNQTKAVLSVELKDELGNAIPNQNVSFSASGIPVNLVQPTTPTDAAGKTSGSFTTNNVGRVTISLLIDGTLFQSAVIDCIPGPASLAFSLGNNQSQVPEQPLPQPIRILVTDAWSHPINGLNVVFEILDGGGHLAESQPIVTDATGTALSQWILGPLVGEQHARAKISGLDTLITFTAFAREEGGAHVAIVSGDMQIVQINQSTRDSLIVELIDAAGHPLPNEFITFSISGGSGDENGSIIPETEQKTDQKGRARVLYKSGTETGIQRVHAQSATWGSVDFTIWVEAERSFTLVKTSEDGQTTRPRETITCSLTVHDVFGRPVADEPLVARVQQGGGSVADSLFKTSADGAASTRWRLGVSGQQLLSIQPVNGSGEMTFSAFVANTAPVFVKPAPVVHNINIPFGEQLFLRIEAKDNESDAVTFEAISLPDGAAFTGANPKYVTWKPADSQIGASDVIVIAADSYGAADSLNIHMDVTEAPDYFKIKQRIPEKTELDVEYDKSVLFSILLNENNLPAPTVKWRSETKQFIEGQECDILFTQNDFPNPDVTLYADILSGDRLMPLSWTVHLHKPTAVELTSFDARLENNSVQLSWRIGVAIDVLGFTLERTSDKKADREKITPEMIPLNSTGNYAVTDKQTSPGESYSYHLFAVGPSEPQRVGSVEIFIPLPDKMVLAQNYPNPFNPTTAIQYILPKNQDVEMALYDVTGKQVRILTQGRQEAGEHTIIWDGLDDEGARVPSGVYVYRLTSSGETLTKKLTLLK